MNQKGNTIMSDIPACPKCQCEYTYEMGHLVICPECAYEWSPVAEEVSETEEENTIKDAYGNELQDGDDVSIVKDLKVSGSSDKLKRGTIVKNIKLVDGDHNIDCRVNGFGGLQLKSEFVKKL